MQMSMDQQLRVRNIVCESAVDSINDFNKNFYKSEILPELKVPLIKMYGILENGEKCLANIHGILPYLLLRTRSPFSDDLKRHIGKLVVQCAKLMDYKISPGYPLLNNVIPFELKDMYGFHESNDHFVKIVFYDVVFCRRVGLALQKECGKNELLQPYLTHIPFILQFFIDFDVFGMGIVKFKNVKFRKFTEKTKEIWKNIEPSILPFSSFMDVEIDVFGFDIILEKSPSAQSEYQCSGLEFIWKEEDLRCQIRNTNFVRPKRPEIGVPVFENEREGTHFGKFRQILNTLQNGNPDFSQLTPTSSAPPLFTQVEIKQTNHLSFEDYLSSQSIEEREEWQEIEQQILDEHDDEQEIAEMSQIVEIKMDQDDEILLDDEPDIVDLTHFKDDDKLVEIEPDYPPIILNQKSQSLPCSNSSSYNEVPTNETWCGEKSENILALEKTIVFTTESPTKMTISQKMVSNLFNDSMKFSSVHHLSVLAIELLFFCNEENNFDESDKAFNKKFLPEVETDPVIGIFFALYDDICNKFEMPTRTGGVVLQGINFVHNNFSNLATVETEKDIFRWIGDFLTSVNPDVIVGYDLERLSLGYLMKRAGVIGSTFPEEASRLIMRKNEKRNGLEDLKGRILMNVWKLIRRDHPMRHYRMSAVVAEILNRRFAELSQYWIEKTLRRNESETNGIIFRHFLRMTNLDIQLLVALDIFIKTSQMARVYGIQFEEVLSRGSQFRVESMLLRLAKQHNFCAPSVSVEQRNAMSSPETMPLNLEPHSGLYYDPVVVLDFQSLYPSVCIAYNYCFTTVLGRVDEYKNMTNSNKIQLGALSYNPPSMEWLNELRKNGSLHISPVGGIFVKKEIRRGLLSMMLEELLETRVMVKQSMKEYNDPVMNRLSDARQLALKLIANVTYGYTAANWSGRMPCSEVADAIVAKGREALENAIQMIENDSNHTQKYKGSKVIYGDTDSLFILMPGLSREEAFKVGKQIANDVTSMNPYPMKLKFEKVMMPCCLMAKKRYVGYSFENESDKKGKFDAKGIETVRRDACDFVAHSMEIILRLLFDKNITGAISYLKYKTENIENIPLEKFVISGDYRGNYAEAAVLPMKKIASELEMLSVAHKPVYGERLEYIVAEPPKSKQNSTVFSCVFRLQKFLDNPELKVHYNYYITKKLLPALSRVFQLVPIRIRTFLNNIEKCQSCGVGGEVFCDYCATKKDVLVNLMAELRKQEITLKSTRILCQSCIEMKENIQLRIPCYNIDCKVWQERFKIQILNLESKLEKHSLSRNYKRVKMNAVIVE